MVRVINLQRTVMVKMDPPKLVPPGTYFIAKYGLPLKNLDHLPEMKQRRPSTYFTCKTWTSSILGGFQLRFLETTQARQFSSSQYTVVSFPAARKSHFLQRRAKFGTNACFEHCVRPLKHTHENQSFLSLDMHL